MKIKESTNIALKISGITSLLFVLWYILIYFSQGNDAWYIFIIGLLVVFFITFWFVRLYIGHYVQDRIKLIYKMIHSAKGANKKGKGLSTKEVQQEVVEWSRNYEDRVAKLKALEQYRKEYIGDIAHELKTPLFALLGYNSTLLDGGINDTDINLKYLQKSEKHINRLIDIVNELDTISQLELGQIQLKIERFNLKTLCDEVIESLEIKASEKNVRVFYGKNYNKPIWVNADKKQIHRVVSNLIKNAIDYGYKHTGTVKISFFDMDDKILTEFTDNGPGIAQEDLSRIFERFYRADKARSREPGGGTGLGLAIVKHIAEVHHQSVFARSTVGIGSTFGFTLEKGSV